MKKPTKIYWYVTIHMCEAWLEGELTTKNSLRFNLRFQTLLGHTLNPLKAGNVSVLLQLWYVFCISKSYNFVAMHFLSCLIDQLLKIFDHIPVF